MGAPPERRQLSQRDRRLDHDALIRRSASVCDPGEACGRVTVLSGEMGCMGSNTDWDAWHRDYEDPASRLSERLRVVQRHIDDWLDETAPGHVAVISACAGDGRDLLGVLEHRTDAYRVSGRLVESDPRNAERATDHAHRLALPGITVTMADAGIGRSYEGATPADLVLLCGIFGNVTDTDVRRTVTAAPQLCNRGALVIWTRHRQEPDLTPWIRQWFASADFREEAFVAPEDSIYSVGVHRFQGEPQVVDPGQRFFTFVR